MVLVHGFDLHDLDFMVLIFMISISWSLLMVLMLMLSILDVNNSQFDLHNLNMMILVDGLDAHDLNFIVLNWFFKFSHVLFSMSKIYNFRLFFSIQWSRLMVWFSCCQFFMLIGHGFDPYDFNFIVLVDGYDVHGFNF
jgi:hypothetical protein